MTLLLNIINNPTENTQFRNFQLHEENATIGRNTNCSWELKDSLYSISRIHAEIKYNNKKYFILDKSLNGIINKRENKKLQKGSMVQLMEGDILSIGQYNIAVSFFIPIKRLPFEPKMVLIKSGSFMMGSNEYNNEKPIHKVIIDYAFEIGKYPVTFEEYDYFCKETKREKITYNGWGREKKPVINVSWNDAKEYAKWLSQKTDKNYRLLTESEWEYVARAGTTTRWCFGNTKSELANYAWYFDTFFCDVDMTIHTVGTKKPNNWGVYDMHGNVFEWCEDWSSSNYYNTPKDGSANLYSKNNYRVLRGGSWGTNADSTRSTYRSDAHPYEKSVISGFRVQRTLPLVHFHHSKTINE